MKWRVHGRKSIYESPWLELWLEDVEIPGGDRFEHHVVRMRPTVTAVVFDDAADRVLLLWRHRFITDVWGWEVPGGWIDRDEAPSEAVRREVQEETGWRPGPVTELGHGSTPPGSPTRSARSSVPMERRSSAARRMIRNPPGWTGCPSATSQGSSPIVRSPMPTR